MCEGRASINRRHRPVLLKDVPDYERVTPKNGDGFVNWLTTHLVNALGSVPVTRTRARITVHAGAEICRVDVAASPEPVWAKTSKDDQVFYVRMNNSTRALPADDCAAYCAARWSSSARS